MTPRHYTDVMRVNGRPAMVRVDEHPNGTRYFHSFEYIDGEVTPEMRDGHRQECASQLEQADEYRSPFPAILMILGCVGAVLFAALGAAAFGTGPLTLPAMLSGAALWAAACGSGWVAFRSYKAATR